MSVDGTEEPKGEPLPKWFKNGVYLGLLAGLYAFIGMFCLLMWWAMRTMVGEW